MIRKSLISHLSRRHGFVVDDCVLVKRWPNVVYIIKKISSVLKSFPRANDCEWKCEVDVLKRIRGRLSCTTPEIIECGKWYGCGFILMTLVPGESCVDHYWSDMPWNSKAEVCFQVGKLLHELHSVRLWDNDQEKMTRFECTQRIFTEDGFNELAVQARKSACREGWISNIAGFLREIDFVSERNGRSLIHREIDEEHIFLSLDGKQANITGVIDFETAMIGDTLVDLSYSCFHFCYDDPVLRNSMLEGYGRRSGFNPEERRKCLVYFLLRGGSHWKQLNQYAENNKGRIAEGDFFGLADQWWGSV